jgi:hypothetical protein
MRFDTDRVVSLSAMLIGVGSLFNTGVGPALIEDVVLRHQGCEVRQDPYDFLLGEVPQSWYEARGLQRSGPDKAIIEVTYKSVYGERWRVVLRQRRSEAALTA